MARLTFVHGVVQVQRPDNTEAEDAPQNMPLAEGWRLATGDDGQAEVEFEDGSLVRLTPSSSVTLDSLSVDSATISSSRLSVVHGLVYLELRASAKYQYMVDAGGDLISPVTNATIRINLDTPPARISVLDGTAHIEKGNGYHADVHAGESLHSDIADADRYFLTPGIDQNSWDGWNEARDQAAADQAAAATSARDKYAGNAGYGWSDLDANGNWYDVPGQGRVWQPDVAYDATFDPYGYGNWVWYPGAGYVWASGYSWGWTPFRCGNWSYWNGFGWGWIPTGGCERFGWGFGGGGGGYLVNIQQYRPHLPPVSVPVRGPGRPPIIVVHGTLVPRPPVTSRGPRTIAEHTVLPLPRVGAGYTPRGGSAVGSALRRDYPVDLKTHAPLLGVMTAPTPGAIVPGAGWRTYAGQPGAQPANRGAYSGANSRTNPGPNPAVRSGHPIGPAGPTVHSEIATPAPRPAYTPPVRGPIIQRERDNNVPRSTLAPQAPPSAPPSIPAPQAPTYAPRYSPPPQAPSYTPRAQPAPQPQPQPRSAPAPSAPAAAPHPSPPSPSKS